MVLTSVVHVETLSGSITFGRVQKAGISSEVDIQDAGDNLFDLLNTSKALTFVSWVVRLLA